MHQYNNDLAKVMVPQRIQTFQAEAQRDRLARQFVPAAVRFRRVRRRVGLSLIRLGLRLAQLEA
ncbi:MAG TPA: hypothetical protein VH186_31160 [Chloroflexia bacterium]|nr:hypothetical protein [Chloroflexia bacterium]